MDDYNKFIGGECDDVRMAFDDEVREEIINPINDKYNRPFVILKILLQGGRVNIYDHIYVMSDDFRFCSVAKDQHGKEHYLDTWATFQSFIKFCLRISEEDFINIAAYDVLNK